MSNRPPIKLNVGCGLSPSPGYHNLDNSLSLRIQNNGLFRLAAQLLERLLRRPVYTRFPQGIHWRSVNRSLPYRAESVEVIYSSHMLEHLPRQDGETFLRDAHRVLVPRGVLRLAVPDLEGKAQQYLEQLKLMRQGAFNGLPADEFMESTRLGLRSRWVLRRPAEIYRALSARDRHMWMWDAPSLMAILWQIGFKEVRECGFRESWIPDVDCLDLEGRRGESVYVEARK